MDRELAICADSLEDSRLTDSLRRGYQGQRAELESLRDTVTRSVEQYCANERRAYESARLALVEKLESAQQDTGIAEQIRDYEQQGKALEDTTRKLLQGVQALQARIEQDTSIDRASREEKIHGLYTKLQKVMLTDEEQSHMAAMNRMLGRVLATEYYQQPQVLSGISLLAGQDDDAGSGANDGPSPGEQQGP